MFLSCSARKTPNTWFPCRRLFLALCRILLSRTEGQDGCVHAVGVRRPRIASLGVAAALFCSVSLSYGQFSSNIAGNVVDSTGAVIPNSAVTLHNNRTGVNLQQTTNGSGFYRFSAVAPGDYSVGVVSKGFKPASISVAVTTNETRGLDVQLMPASTGTDVTVNSIASALNPDETRLQSTISSQEISQLPLPNRDVQLLLALTPGVVGFQNETINGGYGSTIFAGSFHAQPG